MMRSGGDMFDFQMELDLPQRPEKKVAKKKKGRKRGLSIMVTKKASQISSVKQDSKRSEKMEDES